MILYFLFIMTVLETVLFFVFSIPVVTWLEFETDWMAALTVSGWQYVLDQTVGLSMIVFVARFVTILPMQLLVYPLLDEKTLTAQKGASVHVLIHTVCTLGFALVLADPSRSQNLWSDYLAYLSNLTLILIPMLGAIFVASRLNIVRNLFPL